MHRRSNAAGTFATGCYALVNDYERFEGLVDGGVGGGGEVSE